KKMTMNRQDGQDGQDGQDRQDEVRGIFWRYLSYERLTENEWKITQTIKEVLTDIHMSLADVDLLMEMKDKSNQEFHKKLPMDTTKMKLNDFISDDLEQYKDPLLKILNAIEMWREPVEDHGILIFLQDVSEIK